MRPATKPRSLLMALSAAALASTALVPTAKADIGIPLPVLWEGQVEEGGQPASAEVVAFLRPPTEALVPGVPLVPLARTRTDSSGRFTLRSLPTAAVAAVTPETGWVTLMVAAFTEKGIGLAMDSVTWKDGWVTDPAALVAERPLAAQQISTTERPNVLATVPMKSGAPSGADKDQAHAPSGAGSCWLTGSEDLGHKSVNVGELHLNRNWGGLFSYSTTKSSSFEIGVSHQGSGWSAGGSVSMAKHTEFGQPVKIATADTDRYWSWKAKMVYKKFEWGCNKGYPDVHRAETLEPTLWTGDLRRSPEGNPASCNQQYAINVEPTSEPYRKGGSSQTLTGAISVLGFTGSVTSGFSKEVRNEWHNPLDRNRTLCGETGYVTERTRVTSLA